MPSVGSRCRSSLRPYFYNSSGFELFIAEGENSALHYNEAYPRWAYDQYHAFILSDMAAKDRNFLDIWNAIDSGYFTGANFHLSSEGENIKAELLREGFQTQICR